MPQKSTDFYPKMIAGLTMMPVGAQERIQKLADRPHLTFGIELFILCTGGPKEEHGYKRLQNDVQEVQDAYATR